MWSGFMRGFPGGSNRKESAWNAGNPGSVPGLGRPPGEGSGNPLQYSYLEIPWTEEPGGYSSWGHHESDTTEQLALSLGSSRSFYLEWKDWEHLLT